MQSITGLTADRAELLAPVDAAEQAQQRAEERLVGVRALTLLLACVVVAATSASFRVAATRWMAAAGGLSLGALVDEAFSGLAAGLPDPD